MQTSHYNAPWEILLWFDTNHFTHILQGDSIGVWLTSASEATLNHKGKCICEYIRADNNNDLTLIPAWISNHLPSKVWDEITYPFLNFNSCTVEV